MNIFFLDRDPRLCAAYHGDKHVRKMMLEYAQLLCGAHHAAGNPLGLTGLYKPSHMQNRYSLWVRDSAGHYAWLYRLWEELAVEYRARKSFPREGDPDLLLDGSDMTHKSWWRLGQTLRKPPHELRCPWQDPPACDSLAEFIGLGRVEAYRALYMGPKRHLAVWSPPATTPEWFK